MIRFAEYCSEYYVFKGIYEACYVFVIYEDRLILSSVVPFAFFTSFSKKILIMDKN